MIELRPISQADAFAFIRQHHRHHSVPVGALWWHGAHDDDGVLIGVAIVGRPVARRLDDGLTVEVTRLCANGTHNACSMLYGAARRVAMDKGYRRVITYTLPEEGGASLRAAGWDYLGRTPGKSWSVKSRPREDKHPLGEKDRWGCGSWPARAALVASEPAQPTSPQPMWCDECRAVGAVHCAQPDHCGRAISATAAADKWLSWLDDLPLPPEFDPAMGRLQDFIAALTTLLDGRKPAPGSHQPPLPSEDAQQDTVDRATANRLIAELQAKLDAANAGAERLAMALTHMASQFQHPDQMADEALAAHEARKGNPNDR